MLDIGTAYWLSPFPQGSHRRPPWIERTISVQAGKMINRLVEQSPGCARDSTLICLLQNLLLPGSWLIFIPKMPVLSWLPSLNDIILKCLGLEARNRGFSCQKIKNISKANTFCTNYQINEIARPAGQSVPYSSATSLVHFHLYMHNCGHVFNASFLWFSSGHSVKK